jgi:glyoxylase-like metal-dependent hydrolase (beta-lactamase superfamily II)
MHRIYCQIFDDDPDILFLQGEDRARYPYSNSLLIDDLLIDTGIGKKNLKMVKKEHQISTILLSHWHEDHISGNSLFPEAKFMAHEQDASLIEDPKKIPEAYAVLGTPIEEQFLASLESYRLKNTPLSRLLKDGDTITTSTGRDIKVIHTPGHSPGHCCFYIPKSKLCFLADIDLSSFGPWYGCLDSNLMDFQQSIEKIKEFSIECAVTSHAHIIRSSQIIQEQIEIYQSIIKQREDRILNYFNPTIPVTIGDLIEKNIVYNKYNFFKEYLLIAERIMIENHIRKLLAQQRIVPHGSGFCLKNS